MRNSYEKKGDVEFEALYAARGDSTINLLEFVNLLTLYEGVDQPFMSGELTITDANNLFKSFDFRNDTYIVGSFRTPLPRGAKNNIGGQFSRQDIETRSVFVMKVSDLSRTKSIKQNVDLLVMKLTSPSNFINRNKMISRSVKGKGINPVLELMEEYYYDRNNPDRVNLPDFIKNGTYQTGGNRTLDLFDQRYSLLSLHNNSDTETEVRYAFPFKNPPAMVGSILNDLISTSNDFGYKMWETLTGFKVASMQGLFQTSPVMGISKRYTDARFDTAIDERLSSLYAIETLEFTTVGNRLNQAANGAFRSKMYEFDTTTKQLQRRLFDYTSQNPYADSYAPDQQIEKYPLQIPSQFQSEFSGIGYVESFDVSSFNYNTEEGEPDPNLYVDDEGHLNMISQNIMMYDTQLEVTIPGNHILEAGMIINVEMPPNTISETKTDEDVSGSYLINALSHNFEFQGNTHRLSLGLTRNFRTTPKSKVIFNNLEKS